MNKYETKPVLNEKQEAQQAFNVNFRRLNEEEKLIAIENMARDEFEL